MGKAKVKKKNPRVDMTAMCDVSFLLLSFFIMTSTAKLPEPYPVDTPFSTVQEKVPDSNLATITVGDGKVFFGVTSREVRKSALQKMSAEYKVPFTEDEMDKFMLIDGFGVDIRQMSSLIKMPGADRNKKGAQPGIPYDSANNQLYHWILYTRLAARETEKLDLDFAIKGDAEVDYPMIKTVIDILQDQRKNKFYLVTGLRNDDF